MTIFLCAVAMVVSSPALVKPELQGAKLGLKDIEKLQRDAGVYGMFRSAMEAGNLAVAKSIIVNQIASEPGNAGNYLLVAKLSYELQEFEDARRFYREYMGYFKADEQPTDAVAQVRGFGLLVNAMGQKTPAWDTLQTARADLTPLLIADREFRQATSTFHFRTARFLLGELKRLGLSESQLKEDERFLTERIKIQKDRIAKA